jgi:hypothetical protein
LCGQERELLVEGGDGRSLGFRRDGGIEQRAITLVHFRGDVIQQLHEAVTLEGAIGRRQAGLRLLVGDILNDGRAFGEQLPILHDQGRYGALGVDRGEVGAGLGFFALQVDFLGGEVEARFEQHDMGRERTGAG